MAEISSVLAALVWLAEAATLGYVAYRCILGALSFRSRKPLAAGKGDTRFLLLVPANNEGMVIASTVASLRALDYPESQRSIVVVADGCVDATESEARAAGAQVLVKPAPASSKGNVIQWALARPEIRNAAWDALVIFDADSRPEAQFLRFMDSAVASGASAMQGRRDSGEQQGLIPRGYAVNNVARNRLWHQAREAAGFSGALTGAGICLTRAVLEKVPPTTTTLTEDLEYTAKLTEAGVRVHYLHDASIQIEQPPSLAPSVRQRVRWARGQLRTAMLHGPNLVWRAIRRLDFSAFDTALYLLLPSLVPLQAMMFVWAMGQLLAGDSWPNGYFPGLPEIPVWLIFTLLAISLTEPFVGLLVEHRKAGMRDWIAYLFLMTTWTPVAIYAAMTAWVQTWHRTPREGDPAAQAQSAPLPTQLEEDKPRIAPS